MALPFPQIWYNFPFGITNGFHCHHKNPSSYLVLVPSYNEILVHELISQMTKKLTYKSL